MFLLVYDDVVVFGIARFWFLPDRAFLFGFRGLLDFDCDDYFHGLPPSPS